MLVHTDLVTHVISGLRVVHGTDDADGVRMVSGYDEQRIRVLFTVFLGLGDHMVKHDCVVHGPFPVQRMAELVHETCLNHEEEAVGVLGEDAQGGFHGIGQIRLIGETGHRVLLENCAVKVSVHVAGVEETEETACFFGEGFSELRLRADHGIAAVPELPDEVLVILSL
jgi:hypothetical protein